MAQVARVTTWSSGQTLTASALNGEFNNLVNYLNNADAGTTTWGIVKITNSSSVPLVVNNSTGSQNIANFQANGSNAVTIGSAGALDLISTLHVASTTSLDGALTITPTSNQMVLGTTRTVTITAPTPASSSRTWTIPDISGNGTFAALQGTQTFSGSKTFSSSVVCTGAQVTVGTSGTSGTFAMAAGNGTDTASAGFVINQFQFNNTNADGFVYVANVCIGANSTPTYGGGTVVMMIQNASVAPSTNPTGGGILYSQAGALKWRGSSGTVTTIAAA